MIDAAAFRVWRRIINARESRLGNGARAHCAGFKRHPKLTVFESQLAQGLSRCANGKNFGMRCWIIELSHGVACRRDFHTIAQDNGAYRHFSGIGGGLR
jgi:hypothetical protein